MPETFLDAAARGVVHSIYILLIPIDNKKGPPKKPKGQRGGCMSKVGLGPERGRARGFIFFQAMESICLDSEKIGINTYWFLHPANRETLYMWINVHDRKLPKSWKSIVLSAISSPRNRNQNLGRKEIQFNNSPHHISFLSFLIYINFWLKKG